MNTLLSHFGPWLAAIFAMGACTALWRRRPEVDGALSPWLAWGLIAFLIGLVVAGVAALEGRAALWLGSGLAAYGAFLLGCCAGALGRGGRLREHREWALGLLPAALLWIGANTVEIPKIEASLAAAGEATASPAGVADARSEFLEGARRLAEKQGVARGKPVQAADGAKTAGGDQTASIAPAGRKSGPKPHEARLEGARAYLASLPAAGALALSVCQEALEAAQTVGKVVFPSASAEITRPAAEALNGLTPILRRCPDAKIEIAGHTDNLGDEGFNQTLSQRRAESIRRYLVLLGVPAARLSAIGYGSKQPIAPNDDESGRADNRRIDFVLR